MSPSLVHFLVRGILGCHLSQRTSPYTMQYSAHLAYFFFHLIHTITSVIISLVWAWLPVKSYFPSLLKCLAWQRAFSCARQVGWHFWGQSPRLLQHWIVLYGAVWLPLSRCPRESLQPSQCKFHFRDPGAPLSTVMDHSCLHLSQPDTRSSLSHVFLGICQPITVSFKVFTPQIEGRALVNGRLLIDVKIMLSLLAVDSVKSSKSKTAENWIFPHPVPITDFFST